METLLMSGKERKRLEVMGRVRRGELKLAKAAELLSVSYRQVKRIWKRYGELRAAGLVHRLRGRPSNRLRSGADRERAVALYREKYADFGPTLASEHLASDDGLVVPVTTLRRWLRAAGLWQSRRKRAAHRRWRPRKEQPGELVQMDGSPHDWLEGRGPRASLMVMIDDATNRTHAQLFPEETTAAAMQTFRGYVGKYGFPQAIYVDRDSIYETTRDATADEELRETGPLTQFGRAMKELQVKLILAYSPQAKGRVERRHGVFQDRLVKELRLRGINDLAGANRYLEEEFLPELNRRFVVPAKRSGDLHRSAPRGVNLDLVLSFQEARVVQSDWTIVWRGRWFQLTEANWKLSLVKRKVLVCEQLDGTLRLLYRGRELAWEELPARPQRPRVERREGPIGTGRVGLKPPATHPWRGEGAPTQPPRSGGPPCSASVAALPALRKAAPRN
jgi:Helix-turn-helix domain